ncbi:MAG TPA: RimK family alpha-L-glutamate ligase [Porticoccaceae bacterium]|nr:RimK family alpha-L-glutamate ligase [Porticoccaceae bacterium]
MNRHIVVVDQPSEWSDYLPEHMLLSARDYIAGKSIATHQTFKVINLCRSYRYLGLGYYVSLLAEARRHRVIPSVRTMLDLSRKTIYQLVTEELDEDLAKHLKRRDETQIEFTMYFGYAQQQDLQPLANTLFERFPAPVLRIKLRRGDKWQIHKIDTGGSNGGSGIERAPLTEALNSYLGKRWRNPKTPAVSRYDLAILHNPEDALSPSNPKALRAFVKAGKKLGVDVDLITRRDYPHIAEWDALFIRETTSVNHHTFRFAKRAESEGMVVIDDPTSILRCTNKVYLAELLRTHRINAPTTVVIQRNRPLEDAEKLGYPVVLKIPDGAFSLGVYKAKNPSELKEIAARLFKQSDLILAQEFLPSEFDWRVGIIGGKPLFACQYFMSRGHWQIYKHQADGKYLEGKSTTLAVEDTPNEVIQTALKASRLIGDGFYGVDLKQTDKGVFVIEVNDNPNIDVGVEDLVLKDRLYETIIGEFVTRLDQQMEKSGLG